MSLLMIAMVAMSAVASGVAVVNALKSKQAQAVQAPPQDEPTQADDEASDSECPPLIVGTEDD